jgi:hypothetical protein
LSQFLNEIDEYEEKCQANFKLIQQNKAHIEETLLEANLLCSKSTEILKQHKIDELSLKASLDEANLMLEKLEKIGDGLRSEMFNKSIVKFVKKKEIEADQIGNVKFQNVDLFFLENLTNYVQLDLKLEDYCDEYRIQFSPYKNRTFICAYFNQSDNVNLYKLDAKGNILLERKNLVGSPNLSDILSFSITVVNDTIYMITQEEYSDGDEKFILRSYDENFNFVKALILDGEQILIKNCHENVSTYCKNADFTSITIYNADLEILQNFGQKDENLPFYFPISDYILITNEHFIDAQETDEGDVEVTLVKKENGSIYKSFKIKNFSSWVSYLDKYLITFDEDSSKLRTYNLNGDLIEESQLDNGFHGAFLDTIFNKQLCFTSNGINNFNKILFI